MDYETFTSQVLALGFIQKRALANAAVRAVLGLAVAGWEEMQARLFASMLLLPPAPQPVAVKVEMS